MHACDGTHHAEATAPHIACASIEENPSMRSMLKRATFTTTARPVGLDWPPTGPLNCSYWSVRSVRVGASVYKRKDDCGV